MYDLIQSLKGTAPVWLEFRAVYFERGCLQKSDLHQEVCEHHLATKEESFLDKTVLKMQISVGGM